MRIALISDIHGNRIALEAVLSDIRREGIDSILCLGDVAAHGPEPKETVDLVRSLDCPVVMGNTDAGVFDTPEGPPGDEDWVRIGHLYQWCAKELEGERLDFLKSLAPSVQRDELFCCHGSPRSFDDKILATTADADLGTMLAGVEAKLVACGHTHQALLRRFGEITVINPGSVGIPLVIDPRTGNQRLSRYAEYLILTRQPGGHRFDFRHVEFDPAAVRAAGRKAHLPHLDWWLGWWDV